MTGIHIKCEKCGKTLGGEEVTPRQQGIRTLVRGDGYKLRELAAPLGWVHTPPNDDLCPGCASHNKPAYPNGPCD